jgi:PEGA domain-containing protein
LHVESRPGGAQVFLDGRLIGATPLSVPSVAAGEHVIRLERDGYRRWSSSVRIVAAEQNRVTASLER